MMIIMIHCRIMYSTVDEAEASEKSLKTLYPVGIRVSAGHGCNTKFVVSPVRPYRASYINFCNKSENRLEIDMSNNFPVPLHFLHCSKEVEI